jgi:hypothetical protein
MLKIGNDAMNRSSFDSKMMQLRSSDEEQTSERVAYYLVSMAMGGREDG